MKTDKLSSRVEKRLQAALIQLGVSNFELHNRRLPGTPDISFPKEKLIVFVHGCYWHGHGSCRQSLEIGKDIQSWANRIQDRVMRDQLAKSSLEKLGWRVLVAWECEIKVNCVQVALQIREITRNAKQ